VLVAGSLVCTTYECGNGKAKKAKTNRRTCWCIHVDVVLKLDPGEPEPETLTSGSASSIEAPDANRAKDEDETLYGSRASVMSQAPASAKRRVSGRAGAFL
jgi:hypothetical protein